MNWSEQLRVIQRLTGHEFFTFYRRGKSEICVTIIKGEFASVTETAHWIDRTPEALDALLDGWELTESLP